MRWLYTLVVALALASPAAGQMRSLGVPNDKGWQHARTGIILLSKLGEFQRSELRDNGSSELDVAAAYDAGTNADTATIYLYRPGIASLPMWFDRSQYAMMVNPQIQVAAPFGPIARVALPGSIVGSGLRMTYSLRGDKGATGLLMVPYGEWLLAIRVTSRTKMAADVDAALLDLVAKVRWPEKRPAERVADPIAACLTQIKTRKAKLIQPDLAQALIGATLSNLVEQKREKEGDTGKPPVFCRDRNASREFGMYRSDQSSNGYILAIGDSGISASVFPGISLNNRKEFAVTLSTHDSSDTYPSFNALPEPEQLFSLVTSRGPMSRAMRGGNNIILAPSGKK